MRSEGKQNRRTTGGLEGHQMAFGLSPGCDRCHRNFELRSDLTFSQGQSGFRDETRLQGMSAGAQLGAFTVISMRDGGPGQRVQGCGHARVQKHFQSFRPATLALAYALTIAFYTSALFLRLSPLREQKALTYSRTESLLLNEEAGGRSVTGQGLQYTSKSRTMMETRGRGGQSLEVMIQRKRTTARQRGTEGHK